MENLKLYVARDKDGDLFIYGKEPIRKGTTYDDGECQHFRINKDLFKNVCWEDEKPLKIEIDTETMQVVKKLDKDAETKEQLDKFITIQKIVWNYSKDFSEASRVMQALELFCDKFLKK